MKNKNSSRWSKIARRIRVPLGFAFAILYVWLAKPTRASIAVGCIVVVIGLLVRASASGHVRKNEQLAMTGPYAYTRNPLYLGSIIIAVGFGVASLNVWIAAIIVVFFLAVYLPVIRNEEEFLRVKFPEFEDYAARVPRLLPRFTSLRGAGTFSRELYLKHREYNALIGALVLLAILIAKLFWLRAAH
ncbi:MAG TPA: isoprenylcysteine carboxylmethyltransferase family protein [Terriglobales bacterium]|jgi:protein-S-isoprenylcysteine O-methyltransferase Ste14